MVQQLMDIIMAAPVPYVPNLDYLICNIIKFKSSPKILRIDITWAFRNVCIDSADALKLGIYHDDNYYINKSLALAAVMLRLYFKKLGM